MKKIMELIATGLYSGKLPKMPGTWGSILASVFCYLFWPSSIKDQGLIVFVTFILSVISADYLSRTLNSKDPDEVVIDEILGVFITFFGLNPQHNLLLTLLGLALFRAIDIIKPPPIPLFEKLPGGWGITVDDAVAGVVANLLLRILGGFLHV
jgi:phosphatidylglycerophosphatase A